MEEGRSLELTPLTQQNSLDSRSGDKYDDKGEIAGDHHVILLDGRADWLPFARAAITARSDGRNGNVARPASSMATNTMSDSAVSTCDVLLLIPQLLSLLLLLLLLTELREK